MNFQTSERLSALVAVFAGLAITAPHAQTLFFEDFEGGSDGTSITASPYLWTVEGPTDTTIENSGNQDVDLDGLAVCGHCSTWAKWSHYTMNIGQMLPASRVFSLSFQVYAQTGSNGGHFSHWSTVGLRSSNGTTFLQGVNLNVTDFDDGTHHWNFDARHVTDGGANGYAFSPGAFFEEIVTARIIFDMDNNETWGTLAGSSGTESSTKFPIIINSDLDEVSLYWGMFNTWFVLTGSRRCR